MKIYVQDCKEDESLILKDEISPRALDLDIGVMHFSQPLKLNAQVWKSEDELTVQIRVEGDCRYTCSACNEEFDNLFEKDFTLHYDSKGLTFINIDPDVRDEIIVEHPIRIVCPGGCKALENPKPKLNKESR